MIPWLGQTLETPEFLFTIYPKIGHTKETRLGETVSEKAGFGQASSIKEVMQMRETSEGQRYHEPCC